MILKLTLGQKSDRWSRQQGGVGFSIGSKGYIGLGGGGTGSNLSTFYNDLWEYDQQLTHGRRNPIFLPGRQWAAGFSIVQKDIWEQEGLIQTAIVF